MNVFFRIGIFVVVPMVGSPPQNSLLHRHGTDPSENELKDPRGFEGRMRKITMVGGCDSEHPNKIRNNSYKYQFPTERNGEYRENSSLNHKKKHKK